MGQDISGACGQLVVNRPDKRSSRSSDLLTDIEDLHSWCFRWDHLPLICMIIYTLSEASLNLEIISGGLDLRRELKSYACVVLGHKAYACFS